MAGPLYDFDFDDFEEHIQYVTENDIIEVEYTEKDERKAEKWARKLGALKNSITKGKANKEARIGEIVVERLVGGTIMDDFQYDILHPNGAKLEIKTKRTTLKTPPKLHFECSVANYNATQQCDKYIFVRVSTECNKAWILGEIEKSDFVHHSRFTRKGEYDDRNRFFCHADCNNIEIRKLHPITI